MATTEGCWRRDDKHKPASFKKLAWLFKACLAHDHMREATGRSVLAICPCAAFVSRIGIPWLADAAGGSGVD